MLSGCACTDVLVHALYGQQQLLDCMAWHWNMHGGEPALHVVFQEPQFANSKMVHMHAEVSSHSLCNIRHSFSKVHQPQQHSVVNTGGQQLMQYQTTIQ